MAQDTQNHKVFIAFDLFFENINYQQISFYEVTFCPEYPVQNKQPCHYVIKEVGNLNAKWRPSFKVKVTFVVAKISTAFINFLLCNALFSKNITNGIREPIKNVLAEFVR